MKEFDPRPFGAHRLIIGQVGRNKRVLEVGCSSGYISERLEANGCEVIGVEIDKEAARLAEERCSGVIIADVETIEKLPYPDGHFDLILFGDVLEHLKNPWTVVATLKRWLSDEGHIVCSIPNVAHLYLRLKLLSGRWEYEEWGLMDRTHLRFFTLETARNLIEDTGFVIEHVDYSPWIPLFRLRRYLPWATLEYEFVKFMPRLLAFQFIIKARKGSPAA